MENKISETVFKSIKNIIQNIAESPKLNLILCGEIDKKEENFSMLEARVDSIFKELTYDIKSHKIDININNFIQSISSNNSCIPINYYFLFEKNRLTFNEEKCLM